MNREGTLRFMRGRIFSSFCGLVALALAVEGGLDVNSGETVLWAYPLGLSLVFWAVVGLWTLPYATMTRDGLALRVDPVRRRKVLLWSSIQAAICNGASIELVTAGGKKTNVRLSAIRGKQREAFVAALGHKLGTRLIGCSPASVLGILPPE
jgi:hypothetical protein